MLRLRKLLFARVEGRVRHHDAAAGSGHRRAQPRHGGELEGSRQHPPRRADCRQGLARRLAERFEKLVRRITPRHGFELFGGLLGKSPVPRSFDGLGVTSPLTKRATLDGESEKAEPILRWPGIPGEYASQTSHVERAEFPAYWPFQVG